MDEIMGTLDTLTVEELAAIKDRCSELIKQKKAEVKEAEKASKETVKAERTEKAKAALVVGAKITFTMKGQTREALVEKVSDKTATVTLPEGKRYIQFKFITGIDAVVAQDVAA
jgi:hypothetical protein